MDAKEKRTDREQASESSSGLSDAVDKLLTDSATRQSFGKDPVGTLEKLGVALSDEIKQKCRATVEANKVSEAELNLAAVIARTQTQSTTQAAPWPGVATWPTPLPIPWPGVSTGVNPITMITPGAINPMTMITPGFNPTPTAQEREATAPMSQAQACTFGPIVFSWPYTHPKFFPHGPWVLSHVHTGTQTDAISPVRQTRVADLTTDELQVIISSAVDRLLSGLAKLRDRSGIGTI